MSIMQLIRQTLCLNGYKQINNQKNYPKFRHVLWPEEGILKDLVICVDVRRSYRVLIQLRFRREPSEEEKTSCRQLFSPAEMNFENRKCRSAYR